jgi:2'-5' RNA ligase
MLEPVPKGKEFEIWDRHITLVPWFPVDDELRLDDILERIAGKHGKFTVKAGGLEEWGRKEKYPVQLIDSEFRLQSMHRSIFKALENNGFPVHQKDYLGDNYTPHIALRNRLQKGEPIPAGTEIPVTEFTLVSQARLKGSGRMIKKLVKDYELG